MNELILAGALLALITAAVLINDWLDRKDHRP